MHQKGARRFCKKLAPPRLSGKSMFYFNVTRKLVTNLAGAVKSFLTLVKFF